MLHNRVFYKKSFEKFGVSAKGVHWQSKQTQYKRFEIITKAIKKNIENLSVVDAGCGFGEYVKYLDEKKLYPKSYIGVDCEEYMINVAKNRFAKNKFLKKNILFDTLPKADYYICSGAMNILPLAQIEIFIKRCFESCDEGFIFNFIKTFNFANVSKEDIMDIALRYTSKIKIEENYIYNDFTILMVKSKL